MSKHDKNLSHAEKVNYDRANPTGFPHAAARNAEGERKRRESRRFGKMH